MPARRALLVPAPMMPSASTALCATSESVSCERRDSMSIGCMLGLDALSSATASGTARRTGASPYCSRCSIMRIAMSVPSSSPIAITAMPSTAGPWWVAFQALLLSSTSMCSPHMASSSCTFSTSPVPAYAREVSVTWQNLEMHSCRVLATSRVASTASCLPRKSRPSARQNILAKGWPSSASLRIMSACSSACTQSSCWVDTNTRPRDSAAKPATSMGTSVSITMGTSSSCTSSLHVPAYARPRPMMAPTRMAGLSLLTDSYSSAKAGSFSFCTQQLTTPTASSAPATTCGSFMYMYLSICVKPPSTSHSVIMPKLAAALILPCSLFLCIHDTLSSPSPSGTAVSSLSWPKPALTKALTKVAARFCFAESMPAGAEPSTRWFLYTSCGVLGSMTSRSRASMR
mmetsp:Transcript_17190/g.44109  ORF Transcript_17190/g.44109 Transcript_17190/m.44109 type:complete len:403 (+) Transcript_17190:669-1877(+)